MESEFDGTKTNTWEIKQALDNKTLNRLEAAVAKSAYVGQGKKLKVTNKVCLPSSNRTLIRFGY